MTEETPRDVGDVPPDRQVEEKPEGVDPDTEHANPERQGPDPGKRPGDAPKPDAEEAPGEPPPESIPGDEGKVPRPR